MLTVFAVLAVVVAAHVAYRAVVRSRFPADGTCVEVGGVRLHVIERGAGPLAVLVHGSNGVARDFPDALLDDLARDHTVLALDRPGHGHSTRGSGSLDLDANARAVIGLLRARGAAPAVLVGHSYGAAVVLRVALDAPDLVCAVVAVTPGVVEDPRNAKWALAGRALPLLAPLVWVLGLPVGLAISPRVRRAAWYPATAPGGWSASRAFSLCPDQVLHAGENARHLKADLARLARDLPALCVPLRVLVAEQDRITPPALHLPPLRGAPDVDVRWYEGVGHWLPQIHPGCVSEAVRASGGDPAPPPPLAGG